MRRIAVKFFEKAIFRVAHELQKPGFFSLYRYLMKNQWRPREVLLDEQNDRLKRIIRFSYDHIPFYRQRFKERGILPSDIQVVADLQKIPPLTREEIIENKDTILPIGSRIRYSTRTTGGTTGNPMTYLISHEDRFLSGALLYRGWSGSGYSLGNRMMALAGSSLIENTSSRMRVRINELTRNLRFASAFKMSHENMLKYVHLVNSFKPAFLRGYPTALDEFADFIEKEGVAVRQLKGILTTSEKLYPHVRGHLQQVFNCNVFDGYGANDGGIGAYEYECQNLHIDTERSVLEVVDDDDQQVADGEGRVLATNLSNYAMPLLRYELGDQVVVTDEECECGRGLPMLKEVLGRTVSIIYTPTGASVHGWFFQHVFMRVGEQVKRYRIVQETKEQLEIDIVPGNGFGDHTIQQIRNLVSHTCSSWTLNFHIVDDIPKAASGKSIYIESKVRPD